MHRYKQFLLSTGNAVIVEASPYDAVWGIGLDAQAPGIEDPATWNGENLLRLCADGGARYAACALSLSRSHSAGVELCSFFPKIPQYLAHDACAQDAVYSGNDISSGGRLLTCSASRAPVIAPPPIAPKIAYHAHNGRSPTRFVVALG